MYHTALQLNWWQFLVSAFLFDDILLRFGQVLRCSDAFLMIYLFSGLCIFNNMVSQGFGDALLAKMIRRV